MHNGSREWGGHGDTAVQGRNDGRRQKNQSLGGGRLDLFNPDLQSLKLAMIDCNRLRKCWGTKGEQKKAC